MSNIIIHELEPDLAESLEERAKHNGHSIESEIKAILKTVLTPKPNLAEAIRQRFASFDDFEIPEVIREPMRELPDFGEV
jgi:antitoxin FitA